MTAWFNQIRCRSKELDLPRVRCSRQRGAWRRPTAADVEDHRTWRELVAEAAEGWTAEAVRDIFLAVMYLDVKTNRD